MWSVLTRLLEVQVPRRGEYSAQFTEVGVSGCLRKKRINGIRMVCMTENHRNPGTHGFRDRAIALTRQKVSWPYLADQ